jgi:carboxylesterase
MVVRGVRGPVETVFLENSYHMVTVDQERSTVIERSTKFFAHVANTQFVRMPEPARIAATAE